MEIDKLAGLLNRAKQNDDAAINELYGQIHSLIWFWARKVVKSDDDADEVTQRTLITTFRKLDMIQNPDAFLGWLKTTTMRQAKDYMLEAHNRYDISFHDAGDSDDEGNESDYDPAAEGLEYNPAEALDDKVKKEVLGGILDALPSDQRLVVNMFWFDNMTSRAIAEELGCSENTIKSRLKYAKAKIKDKVEEYQKKTGEKLYSVSPIAILLWLYKDAEKSEITKIPWGAEAYPALEQTYHVRPDVPSGANHSGGNSGSGDSGASGSGGADSGSAGSSGANSGASAQASSASSGSASTAGTSATGTSAASASTAAAASAGAAGASAAAHTAGAGILSGAVGKALIAAAVVAGVGGAAVGVSRISQSASGSSAQGGNSAVSESADGAVDRSASGGSSAPLPEDGKILSEDYLNKIGADVVNTDVAGIGMSLNSYYEYTYQTAYEMFGFGSRWCSADPYALSYPTPAILVVDSLGADSKFGIMDYDGNLLQDYQIDSIYYDTVVERYIEYVDGVPYLVNSDYSRGDPLGDGYGGDNDSVFVQNGEPVYTTGGSTVTNPYQNTSGRRFIAQVIDDSNNVIGYAMVDTDNSVTMLPSDGTPIRYATPGYPLTEGMSDAEYISKNAWTWSDWYSTFANGIVTMADNEYHYAFWDADTKSYLTGYDYDAVTYFNEGICTARKVGGGWGFIDRTGKELSDFTYRYMSPVSNGKVFVWDDDGVKILDISKALRDAGYTVETEPSTEASADTATVESASTPVPQTVTVLVDKLNIRTEPSTSSESVGHAERGAVYEYTDAVVSDGYVWYHLADGNWIADQGGEWLSVSGY